MADKKPIELGAIPDAGLDEVIASAQAERVRRIAQRCESLRGEYTQIVDRIQAIVHPYGMTANKFLGMSPEKALQTMLAFDGDRTPRPTRSARAAIKYRHPDNADLTWTGRGNQPRWVREWTAKHGNMDACRVAKA